MSWWQQRMLAFDLETTATDPEEARIVTAALAACGGGAATATETWLADPGVEIPEEAAGVHGVTTERARAEGRPLPEVVAELVATLDAWLQGGVRPLVIFNARYDLTVLDRAMRRLGLGSLDDLGELRVIDPLVLDKWLDRYRRGSRKLEETCRVYGATLDGAHDAAYDAIAAARLAWCIGAKGCVVRKSSWPAAAAEKHECVRRWDAVRGDLDLLHAFQVEEAREQALGLAEHFREKGQIEDADGVRTEWPVVPFEAACEVAA